MAESPGSNLGVEVYPSGGELIVSWATAQSAARPFCWTWHLHGWLTGHILYASIPSTWHLRAPSINTMFMSEIVSVLVNWGEHAPFKGGSSIYFCHTRMWQLPVFQKKTEIWTFICNPFILKCWQLIQCLSQSTLMCQTQLVSSTHTI